MKKDPSIMKENMKWTLAMDEVFIQALLDQHYKVFWVDGTFTPTAYNNIINELKKKLGIEFTKNHLKNQLKTLKEHFKESCDFFRNGKLSGFSWNPFTKTWGAEPEVWEQLLQDSLEELFAKDRAIGQGAETAKEKRMRWMNEPNGVQFESIIEIDDMLSQNEISLENFNNSSKELDAQRSKACNNKQSQGTTATQGKQRKVTCDEEFESLKGALHNIADSLREGNTILEKSRPGVYSEKEIYDELVNIGVEADLIDDYYVFLCQNTEKVRSFFGCPSERRRNILNKLMNGF
ncbi:uncharacterized protein LOC113769246 [Coffea eugenioides]|uniref:uncharacterized protein LOC113769213 n=1 Tax=Coffea eugenioides TaxID=49369 RepID=UPI000F609083|nr:uncharacterized protein LOC113769213 [Coffea eugenioides]XP_027169512.1 uncharacterized protein LOC113769246 [Coffea eugenioides]